MDTENIANLLRAARRATARPTVELKSLAEAVSRYEKAIQFHEHCRREQLLPNGSCYHEPTRALLITQQAGEIAQKAAEAFKASKRNMEISDAERAARGRRENEAERSQAISELNSVSEDIAQMICEQNSWLHDKDPEKGLDRKLIQNLEGKLWWIGSFGKADLKIKQISWEKFWSAFSEYMGQVYGYPIEEKDDDFSDYIQTALKACFGKLKKNYSLPSSDWDVPEDILVTLNDFKRFYQRFGPWSTLYMKSLTLCDFDGNPASYFCMTRDRKNGKKYLKGQKNLKFILRFSSQNGYFVYQNNADNHLIKNSPSGYELESVAEFHPNIADLPTVLKLGWDIPEDEDVQEWRDTLENLDSPVIEVEGPNKYGLIKAAKGEDKRRDEFAQKEKIDKLLEGQESIRSDIHAMGDDVKSMDQKMEDLQQQMKVIHGDVIKFGLKLLTELEATAPRLFYMIPAAWELYNADDLSVSDKARLETWHVHILCEGRRLVSYEDEKYYECHETDDLSDRHEIEIPNEKLSELLPWACTGLKIARLCIEVACCQINPVGDALASCVETLKLKLDKHEKRLEKLVELHGKAEELQREPQEDYKSLREILYSGQLNQEDLMDGKCGSLRLMWDSEEGRATWVCPEHQADLVPLTPQQRIKYQMQPTSPPCSDSASPSIQLSEVDATGQTSEWQLLNRSEKIDVLLIVTCLKAEGLPNVEEHKIGSGDTIDPYVQVTPYNVNGESLKTKKTKRKDNTEFPKWEKIFKWSSCYFIERVKFDIWDHNYVSYHTFVGSCVLEISDLYDDTTGKLVLKNMKLSLSNNGKDIPGYLYIDVESQLSMM